MAIGRAGGRRCLTQVDNGRTIGAHRAGRAHALIGAQALRNARAVVVAGTGGARIVGQLAPHARVARRTRARVAVGALLHTRAAIGTRTGVAHVDDEAAVEARVASRADAREGGAGCGALGAVLARVVAARIELHIAQRARIAGRADARERVGVEQARAIGVVDTRRGRARIVHLLAPEASIAHWAVALETARCRRRRGLRRAHAAVETRRARAVVERYGARGAGVGARALADELVVVVGVAGGAVLARGR